MGEEEVRKIIFIFFVSRGVTGTGTAKGGDCCRQRRVPCQKICPRSEKKWFDVKFVAKKAKAFIEKTQRRQAETHDQTRLSATDERVASISGGASLMETADCAVAQDEAVVSPARPLFITVIVIVQDAALATHAGYEVDFNDPFKCLKKPRLKLKYVSCVFIELNVHIYFMVTGAQNTVRH